MDNFLGKIKRTGIFNNRATFIAVEWYKWFILTEYLDDLKNKYF